MEFHMSNPKLSNSKLLKVVMPLPVKVSVWWDNRSTGAKDVPIGDAGQERVGEAKVHLGILETLPDVVPVPLLASRFVADLVVAYARETATHVSFKPPQPTPVEGRVSPYAIFFSSSVNHLTSCGDPRIK